MAKQVVIVGFGALGAEVAQRLEQPPSQSSLSRLASWLPWSAGAPAETPEFDVTVVERRERFYLNPFAPRGLVQASFAPKLFVPYDNVLKRGTYVHDEAVEIRGDEVVLKSGATKRFDYLVIGTGSSYDDPFKAGTDSKHTEAVLKRYQDALKTAKSVLIVGGGTVGVEVAAEIKEMRPETAVTIVHSGDKLMHTTPVNDKFRQTILDKLANIGVDVVFNTKIDLTPQQRADVTNHVTTRTLKSTDGREFSSDVQIITSGFTGFNTQLLRSSHLDEHIDETTGKIKVNKHMQLEGRPNIFVGGDVAAAGDTFAQFQVAMAHAKVIIDNIRKLAAGSDAPLSTYTPSSPVIVVTIGSKDSLVQGVPFQYSIVGHMLGQVKAGEYFVNSMIARFHSKLNYTYVPVDDSASTVATPHPTLNRNRSWFGFGSAAASLPIAKDDSDHTTAAVD